MKKLKIIRAVPNISVQSGEGITTYAPNRHVTVKDCETLKLILSSMGMVQEVPEIQMDSISALTASGPAMVNLCNLIRNLYKTSMRCQVFTVIKAMTDGGIQQGIPLKIALRCAAQTALGAAKSVLTSKKHPAILRDEVYFRSKQSF